MKIRIVLVGVGRFGNNHLRNLIVLDNKKKIDLVGVVDEDIHILKKIEKKYKVEISNDFKKFVNTTDAFDIVTPASTHYKIVKFLLNKNKHVFVEKPLAMNQIQAKELVKLAKRKKLILQIGHIFRYNSAIDKIKQIVNRKNNYPFYITGKFLQTTKPKRDVGAIFNYIHHFDVLDNILGTNPKTIWAKSNLNLEKTKTEINASVFMQYPKGLNVSLNLGWIPSGKYRTLELYSKKQYTYCDLEKQIIELYKNGKLTKIIKFTFKEPLALELNEFVRCIKTGKQPKANGNIGYRIVKIAEFVTKSAHQKRIIKFPKSME